MAATDILRTFSRVQPKGQAPDAREFVEMQLRVEQAIAGLVKFCRTAVPANTYRWANLTAAQVAEWFDASGRGKPGYPEEGWLICNGNNGTTDLSGLFLRGSTSEAGATGGSDSSAHTHAAGSYVADIHLDSSTILENAVVDDPFDATLEKSLSGAGAGASTDTSASSTKVSGTSGAASVTDNRPAFYTAVILVRE